MLSPQAVQSVEPLDDYDEVISIVATVIQSSEN